jgi:hypothetical protein
MSLYKTAAIAPLYWFSRVGLEASGSKLLRPSEKSDSASKTYGSSSRESTVARCLPAVPWMAGGKLMITEHRCIHAVVLPNLLPKPPLYLTPLLLSQMH